MFFRDPFNLVPAKDLAELADKFTRNEILSSNEFRGIIGFRPSTDPKADQLINSNLNHSPEELEMPAAEPDPAIAPDQKTVPSVQPSGNGVNSQNGVDDPAYRQQVFDSLSDEQKDAVYSLIGYILEDEQNQKGGNS